MKLFNCPFPLGWERLHKSKSRKTLKKIDLIGCQHMMVCDHYNSERERPNGAGQKGKARVVMGLEKN